MSVRDLKHGYDLSVRDLEQVLDNKLIYKGFVESDVYIISVIHL